LHNTSTFELDGRSQCLCCFLPINWCAFGAHLDVGLAQRPSPCRFAGTLHVSFPHHCGRMAVFDKIEPLDSLDSLGTNPTLGLSILDLRICVCCMPTSECATASLRPLVCLVWGENYFASRPVWGENCFASRTVWAKIEVEIILCGVSAKITSVSSVRRKVLPRSRWVLQCVLCGALPGCLKIKRPRKHLLPLRTKSFLESIGCRVSHVLRAY